MRVGGSAGASKGTPGAATQNASQKSLGVGGKIRKLEGAKFKFCQLILRKIVLKCCHQIYFKTKMHQIRFRLGLSPDPLTEFDGSTSKGREGRKGRKGEGREEEGREMGKVASWLLGGWTPLRGEGISV